MVRNDHELIQIRKLDADVVWTGFNLQLFRIVEHKRKHHKTILGMKINWNRKDIVLPTSH